MALQILKTAVGNLQDDTSGNNYAVAKPVYILNLNKTLATIYSDENGTIPITQDGVNNVSDSRGTFICWVEAGDYIQRVGGIDERVSITGADYFNNRVDQTVNDIIQEVANREINSIVGSFEDGFTYTDAKQLGSYGTAPNIDYYVFTGGIDDLPHNVSAATNPDSNPLYQKTNFNASSNVVNDDGTTAQDTYRLSGGMTSVDAIAEDAPIGTRYRFPDLDYATYESVNGSDSGGYYYATMVSGRKLRLIDGKMHSISSYINNEEGETIRDDIVSYIASVSDKLTIPSNFKFRISDVPESFKIITGGGRLIWDNDAAELINYTMPTGFTIKDLEIEAIYRNRLSFSAQNMKLQNVREIMSDIRTEPARYNAVEWNGLSGSVDIQEHRTFNTGLRVRDAHLSVSGLIAQMNNYGQGIGSDTGTDGIKTSGCLSQNIDNVKVFGCSRDIIDTFIGGGEANFSNFWADGFYINSIEIKTEGTSSSDDNVTPHDVNFTNFFTKAGGNFSEDIFAGIVIFNQNKGSYSNSPRKINFTNVNMRGIGNGAGGTYHGVRADGAYQLNFSNCNILDAKDSGMSLTDSVSVTLTNSNIHGRSRGISASSLSGFKASNSTIGYDEESGSKSTFALIMSDACEDVSLVNVDLYGSSRAISVENHTLDKFKMIGGSVYGAIRIDEFTDVSFTDVEIDREDLTNSGDAFLSGNSTPSNRLKIKGGTIKNARYGVNQQSLNLLTCIGVDFENVTSPFGGAVANNNRRIIGCSTDSGSFPTASIDDYIEGNIE